MSKEEYLKAYPTAAITSKVSTARFKHRGQNFAWLKRAKARGDDLTAYKEKMGRAVSEAITSNPGERKRRSELMGELNRRPEARKRSSDVARLTSTRPEILKARAERLARWRELNPDEFYEKCTKAAHAIWHSIPELALFDLLKNVEGYDFVHNQVVKSVAFPNKSKRKQVDIADRSRHIYVEFDGIIHFNARIKGEDNFERVKCMDAMLDDYITKHDWTLIRISYDQFSYKDGGRFEPDCLKKLFEILKDPRPGVHRIGKAYEKTAV
jgi:hypothetical protein